MKKTVLVSAVLIFAMSGFPVFAEEGQEHKGMHSEHGAMMEQESDVPNVGNKICPVSGVEIGKMGEGYVLEHEGKAYKLCCKMCAEDFKKDPSQYIEKINEELKSSGHSSNSGPEGA